MHTLLLSLALFAADPSAENLGPFRGTVKDHQGNPLADVLVAARTGYGEHFRRTLTRTNAQGEFALAALKATSRRRREPISVHALKHGWAASHLLSMGDKPLPESLAFELKPAHPQTVTVIDPSGKPVKAARLVQLTYPLNDRDYGVVDELLDNFNFESDADGKLVIDILPLKDARLGLAVKSDAWGQQWRYFFKGDLKDPVFQLERVGSLTGRAIVPSGLSAEGISFAIEVRREDYPYFIGSATIKADAEGKFVVPALAAGNATIRTELDSTKLLRPGKETLVSIVAGQQAQVELKLGRAIRVTGTVVELQSGEPVGGATVRVSNHSSSSEFPEVITDAKGGYSVSIGTGQISAEPAALAPPHYEGVHNQVSATSKEDAESLELPPLRVPRGMTRKGVVVDAQDRPAPGAWVTATWIEEQDQYSTLGSRSAKADAEGRFVLPAVSARTEIYLRADTSDQAGEEYVAITPESKEPIRLKVSPEGAAVLAGQVVDKNKKPIAGATVEIHAGYRQLGGMRAYADDTRQEWKLTTDADGRFQMPHALPRTAKRSQRFDSYGEGGVYVTITAPGYLKYNKQHRIGSAGSPFILPDLVLERESRVAGRVLDRQGKPVAGVALRTAGMDEHRPAVATSDQEGRFELKNVHPRALFYFAEHKDFAFTGQAK